MKLAYVYFYEFVDEDEIYRHFIKKSITSLITTGMCCGENIFINMLGVNQDIIAEMKEFSEQHNINIYDVSEGITHYYDYLKIDTRQESDKINNAHVRFYNHKFTNYKKIIDLGYDGIIQLDADIIFYGDVNYLFNSIDTNQKNVLYAMHVPSQYGTFSEERIRGVLLDRDDNNLPFFSFSKQKGKKFTFLKKVCEYMLGYNLDNFVSDIHKLGFWPSGGVYFFTKEVIRNHGDTLSLVNYLITKDDELAALLVCLSRGIAIKTMDIDEISTFDIQTFKSDPDRYKIFHPGGREQKLRLIQDGLNMF